MMLKCRSDVGDGEQGHGKEADTVGRIKSSDGQRSKGGWFFCLAEI